jgi:hypothetical protein
VSQPDDARAVSEQVAEELEPAPQFVRHTHEGAHYLSLIAAIHRRLEPQTYLEIGSDVGDSLRLARCTTLAVDPRFRIASDVIGDKPALHLFRQTSDAFFRSGVARTLAPGGIDLAFLDGLHLFEYLLRDFINTEKLSHGRSVILLHDCLPPNIEIAERDYRPHLRKDDLWRIYWTGDVWKLIPILRQWRPDLTLTLFDTPPSGLVMVTGLDPESTVLEKAYPEILARHRAAEFDAVSFAAFYEGLTITPSAHLLDGAALSAFL